MKKYLFLCALTMGLCGLYAQEGSVNYCDVQWEGPGTYFNNMQFDDEQTFNEYRRGFCEEVEWVGPGYYYGRWFDAEPAFWAFGWSHYGRYGYGNHWYGHGYGYRGYGRGYNRGHYRGGHHGGHRGGGHHGGGHHGGHRGGGHHGGGHRGGHHGGGHHR